MHLESCLEEESLEYFVMRMKSFVSIFAAFSLLPLRPLPTAVELTGIISYNTKVKRWYISVSDANSYDNVTLYFPCNLDSKYSHGRPGQTGQRSHARPVAGRFWLQRQPALGSDLLDAHRGVGDCPVHLGDTDFFNGNLFY